MEAGGVQITQCGYQRQLSGGQCGVNTDTETGHSKTRVLFAPVSTRGSLGMSCNEKALMNFSKRALSLSETNSFRLTATHWEPERHNIICQMSESTELTCPDINVRNTYI